MYNTWPQLMYLGTQLLPKTPSYNTLLMVFKRAGPLKVMDTLDAFLWKAFIPQKDDWYLRPTSNGQDYLPVLSS